MSKQELVKQALERNLVKLLEDFNKTLEKYQLSELEVVGVKLGGKSEKAPILTEFNEILKKNGIENIYVSVFTLAKKTGREGFCQVEGDGFWITITCKI